jgi:electron transfer flavoprotein alpha subunit
VSDLWVLAETHGGELKRVSLEVAAAARSVVGPGNVVGVVIGSGVAKAAEQLAAAVDAVIVVDDARLDNPSTEGVARVVASLAREGAPAAILGGATFHGRDLAARVGAELDVDVAQDAVRIRRVEDGGFVVDRPVYAGKALVTVSVAGPPAMVTLRPNSYAPAAAGAAAPVTPHALAEYQPGAIVTAVETSKSARPDVAEADVIVSGGRGMGGPEHFHLIEELADALGAAVGASRAVVDAGWRPHAEQVGQTGKTVSPSLYVACGISGAVQHLAGMKTSQVIVAINKDAEAPIFSVADYGIVGDVFEIVPAVTRAVRELKGTA